PKGKRALTRGVTDMRKRLKMLGGTGAHGAPLDVLLAVSRAIPPRLAIEIDDMQIDDSGLKITGKADSFASIDSVKKALGQSPVFGDIQVTDAKVGADHGRVEFHLSAGLKDSGAI